MKQKMVRSMLAAVVAAALVTGCGSTAQAPADAQAQEEDTGLDEADTAEEADKAQEPAAEEPEGNEENYDYYVEDTDVSMEELREANTPANMIGTHQSLGYTWENYDAQENLQSTVKGQFLMHDGKLWHDAVFTSASGESNYYSDYEADDSPGAIYEYMEGVESGAYWLTIYPSDEYRYWFSRKWMPDLYPEQKEEIFDTSTQDGAILLQVRTTYTDMDNYGETLYLCRAGYEPDFVP